MTVLDLLSRACDLVQAGRHTGIIGAISTLKHEASSPKRDLAYYAVLETVSAGRGEVGVSTRSVTSRDATMALLDASIRRIRAKLH